METRLYIFIGLMTLINLLIGLYQHRKTRKDLQEIKVRLHWIKQRQLGKAVIKK